MFVWQSTNCLERDKCGGKKKKCVWIFMFPVRIFMFFEWRLYEILCSLNGVRMLFLTTKSPLVSIFTYECKCHLEHYKHDLQMESYDTIVDGPGSKKIENITTKRYQGCYIPKCSWEPLVSENLFQHCTVPSQKVVICIFPKWPPIWLLEKANLCNFINNCARVAKLVSKPRFSWSRNPNMTLSQTSNG